MPTTQVTDDGEREGIESISTDDVFFTLSNERRRHVMQFLREQGGEVAMRDLVREVAARERGIDPDELTYDQRKSVYVSLRQTHLPKMAKLGIVEFDSNAGTISLVDGIGEFDFYYEPVRAADIDWGQFYVGLAAIFALLVGASTAGLFPFGLLPSGVLPWLVIVSVAIAGTIQTYLTHRRKLDVVVPVANLEEMDQNRRNGS